MTPLRLAFMGTPDFAVPTLRALQGAGHDVRVVYCQPPKPSGRGHQIQKSPVHLVADELNLEVRTPKTLRDEAERNYLAALNLDAIVVVAYGLILPQAVLDLPRLGCLNVHFSILPRWRGAAPVPWAILSGDEETGVAIMQMNAGLDTGDVLFQSMDVIPPEATSESLLAHLADEGAWMMLDTLVGRDSGTLLPVPQDDEGATYAAKLTREHGKIDWTKPAVVLERQIRAFTPWPGSFFLHDGEPIKVLSATVQPVKNATPGTLLDDEFTVACGEDSLRLVTVQRAGKKPTDGASLLRGMRLEVGHRRFL